MKKLKVKDLRIGDIVTEKKRKYPMRIVGIFEDGSVYLDFDGNEGDVIDAHIRDLVKV